MEITQPSLTRLSRRAGIKSVSETCFPYIRALIEQQLDAVVYNSLLVNSEHQTKTLMPENVFDALGLMGYNLAQSQDLGTTTIGK